MSGEDWTVQASYKHGAQQQHLLNVRGGSPQELKNTLDVLTSTDAAETVVSFGSLLTALDAVVNTLQQPVPPSQTPLQALRDQGQSVPAAAPAPPPSAGPRCVHGERKFVSKVGAKGPWKAWMCPSDRNDPTKCEPEWIA